MKGMKNGVSWDHLPEPPEDVDTRPYERSDNENDWGEGNVAPSEIKGEWGFFTVLTAKDACIPESILAAAVKESKVRPDGLSKDPNSGAVIGYWAIHRSSYVYRILVLNPVCPREAGDAHRGEEPAEGAFIKRYPSLGQVRIESRVWSRIGITFPCTLVAWHHKGVVYVSEPMSYADWRLTGAGTEAAVKELRMLRVVRENRNGFPGLGPATSRKRSRSDLE